MFRILAKLQVISTCIRFYLDGRSSRRISKTFKKQFWKRKKNFQVQIFFPFSILTDFTVAKIGNSFPFHVFFSNAAQPLFKGEDWEEDMDIANGCWWHIKNIFEQLEEFRAFELLRTGLDRTRYLLVIEAKIIAMTCTHAALKVTRFYFR